VPQLQYKRLFTAPRLPAGLLGGDKRRRGQDAEVKDKDKEKEKEKEKEKPG
jgi:hypothetical protein